VHGSLVPEVIAILPVVILSATAWLWTRRRQTPLADSERVSPKVLAFHLGPFTYLGTVLTRKSGDYRLVFLPLTLPPLLGWAAGAGAGLRTTLARRGPSPPSGAVGGAIFLHRSVGEPGSLAVPSMFVALLAASVPRSLRSTALHAPHSMARSGEQVS
jgi:hypothetical protein